MSIQESQHNMRVVPYNWQHRFILRDKNLPWDNPPINSTQTFIKPNFNYVTMFGYHLFEPGDTYYEDALTNLQDGTQYPEVRCSSSFDKATYDRMLNTILKKFSRSDVFQSFSKNKMGIVAHRLIKLMMSPKKKIIYDVEVLLYRKGKLYAKHMRVRFDKDTIIFAKVIGYVPQNDVQLLKEGKQDNVQTFVNIYNEGNDIPLHSDRYYRTDDSEKMFMPKNPDAYVSEVIKRNMKRVK